MPAQHSPDPADADDTAHGRISVISEVAADQTTYLATIHYTPDLSYPLTTDEALRYAATLLRAAAAAAYDAAVYAQLTRELHMPQRDAAALVVELRGARGQATWQAGPLTVIPGVSGATHQPFLRCEVPGQQWQWAPAEVHQHVRHVLDCAASVDYDAAYRRFLVERVGIEPDRALAVVAAVAGFRDGADQ